MSTLLTSRGLVNLSFPFKYSITQILDADEPTVDAFAKMLMIIPNPMKRFEIIYTLSLNGFLVEELTKSRKEILAYMESTPPSSFGLQITGLKSNLFKFLEGMGVSKINTSSFERSFYFDPGFFTNQSVPNNQQLRAQIVAEITPTFALSVPMVERTFNLIDQIYCKNMMKYRLIAAQKSLTFRISSKMIRTAGSMTTKPNGYEITISERLNEVMGQKCNSGLVCNGPVDAFVVTLQHEITHLIVHLELDLASIGMNKNIFEQGEMYKSHGTLFKSVGERFFGLTERTHSLFESEGPSEDEPSSQKSSLRVGQQVTFQGRGASYSGVIVKLNPSRAQVRVETGVVYNVPYQIIRAT